MASIPTYIGKSSPELIRQEGSSSTYTKWWFRYTSISGLAVGDRLFAVVGLFKTTPETTVIAPPGWSLLINANALRVYTKIATVDDTWPELVALTAPQKVSFIFYNPKPGGLRFIGEFVETYCYRNGKILDGYAGVRYEPTVGSPGSPHPIPVTRSRYPAYSKQFSGELSFRFSGANFGNSTIDSHTIRSKNAPSASNTWSWVIGDASITGTTGKSLTASAKGWPGNTIAFDSYHDFAIVMVGNTPPAKPQLISPLNGGRIDIQNVAPTFDWAYSSEDGSPQAKYSFRRASFTGSTKNSYEYWNATTSAWQSAPVWNASAASELTFPTGVWQNGTTYAWAVAVESGAALQSDYSDESKILGDTAPLVSITSPGSLVTNTSQPTIMWNVSDPESQTQVSYEIGILQVVALDDPDFDYQDPMHTAPPGTVVWGSGETLSPTQWRTSPVLHNNQDYVVFVRVNNGQYSPWENQPFTVSLVVPTAPSLSVVVE